MQIGYVRVSKADGSQSVDLQLDQLISGGVNKKHIYTDHASGKKDDRPGLEACDVALKVLTGQGANIDTTTSTGKLVFGIFAALAEYERDLISERTRAGLLAARARGRRGGRRHTMTPGKVRLAMTAMGNEDTVVSDLCVELGITRQTLYRYVSPTGALRDNGKKLLKASKQGQKRR
jgi:DNA invertase Pin-like site-specific DNA recombinase